MSRESKQRDIEILRNKEEEYSITTNEVADIYTSLNNEKMENDGSNLTNENIQSLQSILNINQNASSRIIRIGEIIALDFTVKIMLPDGFDSNAWVIKNATFQNSTETLLTVDEIITPSNLRIDSIYANNNAGFQTVKGTESESPTRPIVSDDNLLFITDVLVTEDGLNINQPVDLSGFKEIIEDQWKIELPDGSGNYNLGFNDKRTCFSLETLTPSSSTKNLLSIDFSEETTRDITFIIKNNTNGSVVIPSSLTSGLSKGFSDNTPFTIPSLGSAFVKYEHAKDLIEILKVGSSDSITSVSTDTTLKGTGTIADPLGLSVAKNAEIDGKLDKSTGTAQTVTSAVTFSGNVTAPKYILTTQSNNTTVSAMWSDGTFVYFNGTGGTPKKLAYDETGVNVPVIHLTATTINIATATDANGYKMHGKSVVHDNTSDATITVSSSAGANFICEGVKTTNNLTFVAGSGVTIIQEDGSLVVNGAKGSSYRLRGLSSTEFALSIRNI